MSLLAIELAHQYRHCWMVRQSLIRCSNLSTFSTCTSSSSLLGGQCMRRSTQQRSTACSIGSSSISSASTHHSQLHRYFSTPSHSIHSGPSTPATPYRSKRELKSLITRLISLRTDSSSREKAQHVIIFGRKMIEEYVKGGGQVKELFVTEECKLKLNAPTQQPSAAASSSSTIPSPEILSHADLQRIIGVESAPTDSCAAIVPIPYTSAPSHPFLRHTLLLDSLADPGNIGTLIRSASAFNFDVILLQGCDTWNDKLVRSSLGAVLKVKIWRVEKEEVLVEEIKKANPKFVVCDASVQESVPITSWRPSKANASSTSTNPSPSSSICLIIGNEATGVRSSLRSLPNSTSVHIPMNPLVESLNASVAGSIFMQHIHATSL